eukprot:825086-Pyramimonas_sp.AAC.1
MHGSSCSDLPSRGILRWLRSPEGNVFPASTSPSDWPPGRPGQAAGAAARKPQLSLTLAPPQRSA